VDAGKTLVARALAAQASKGAGRRVSFFMRKGADVLSKWWVGAGTGCCRLSH
jgi:SpoVK/Ycf46/Vps4 family AAA+-type ATPase